MTSRAAQLQEVPLSQREFRQLLREEESLGIENCHGGAGHLGIASGNRTWQAGKPTQNLGFNRTITLKSCTLHCHVWLKDGIQVGYESIKKTFRPVVKHVWSSDHGIQWGGLGGQIFFEDQSDMGLNSWAIFERNMIFQPQVLSVSCSKLVLFCCCTESLLERCISMTSHDIPTNWDGLTPSTGTTTSLTWSDFYMLWARIDSS